MAGGISSQRVLVGTPQQSKVTGAILRAPVGTELPETLDETINAAFVGCGYISDAGLGITPEVSTTDIKDWAGEIVRKIVESFTGTVEWEHLEMLSQQALENYFGKRNVTRLSEATTDKGNQFRAELRKDDLEHWSWIFLVKDGDRRVMVVVEDGQITERQQIKLVSNDAAKLGVKLSTFAGTGGEHAYMLIDDGERVPLTPTDAAE